MHYLRRKFLFNTWNLSGDAQLKINTLPVAHVSYLLEIASVKSHVAVKGWHILEFSMTQVAFDWLTFWFTLISLRFSVL